MTAEQMKYEFDVGYDRITNFDAPGYVPKEISTFLTRAQEDIIYDILDASENKEMNRKAISKLRQVLSLTAFSSGNYPNGFSTSLLIILAGGTDFTLNAGNIVDDGRRFIEAGFRVGDVITITGHDTDANNGQYSVVSVSADILTLSAETQIHTPEGGDTNTTITVDPILRVRNERADVRLLTGHDYYGKVTNNLLQDIEVDPVDDDFYHANKNNPYKKPSKDKIWRLDYAGINTTLGLETRMHEYILEQYTDFSTGVSGTASVHLHIDRKPTPIIVPAPTGSDYEYTGDDENIDGVYFVDFKNGLDCSLDPIIHRKIVEKAVKLAYAALQDEKGFQISSVQEQQE